MLTANNYGNFAFFHKVAPNAKFCLAARRNWYNSVTYSTSSQFFVGKNSVIRILMIPE